MNRLNAAELVGHFAVGSPEWHAARANGLGGSEIAPVLGLSPWESLFSLWHRKAGLAAPTAENDVMYWGKLLERTIREEFNRRHADDGLNAVEAGTWRHVDRPWQIANPDGLIGDRLLFEAKTARTDDGWGEEGTDEIPVYYRAQVLWYLDVFGLDLCHLAVLIGGSEYREYQVTASAEEAEFMRERALAFLGTVERRERPSIDDHDATYAIVRELHPDIEDVRVDVPGTIAVPYLDANEAYKKAKAEKQRAGSVLADFMGNARRAFFDGDQIAMRIAKGDNLPHLQATTRKTAGLKVSAA
jgi:putative phage-type endonuclease